MVNKLKKYWGILPYYWKLDLWIYTNSFYTFFNLSGLILFIANYANDLYDNSSHHQTLHWLNKAGLFAVLLIKLDVSVFNINIKHSLALTAAIKL